MFESLARPSLMKLVHSAIHIVAGLVLIRGAVMPWLTGATSTAGIEYGEGKLIFALGIVALVLAIGSALPQTPAQQLGLSFLRYEVAVVVLIVGVQKLVELRDLLNAQGFVAPHIGHGLYVTLAGGSLLAATGLAGVSQSLWHLARGLPISQVSSSSHEGPLDEP